MDAKKPAIPYVRTGLGVSMLLCAKPGFSVIIQAGSVLQYPFLSQLGIDIHDHGCVCVPHLIPLQGAKTNLLERTDSND